MKLENIMVYSLIFYMVFSLILMISVILAKNPATVAQDISLGAVNILAGGIGLFRIKKIKENTQDAVNKKAIIAAQHSWLVLSLTTAVLVLLFGNYFSDAISVMVIQYIILTIISVLAAYVIIVVAMKKLPILE
ncbi:MAG: hypothetical protein ACP5R3_06420 [Thermoplasmata archaeon]